jgi:hypothetical protein
MMAAAVIPLSLLLLVLLLLPCGVVLVEEVKKKGDL